MLAESLKKDLSLSKRLCELDEQFVFELSGERDFSQMYKSQILSFAEGMMVQPVSDKGTLALVNKLLDSLLYEEVFVFRKGERQFEFKKYYLKEESWTEQQLREKIEVKRQRIR